MGVAFNTIERFFAQRTTSLAAATRHDFAAITLDFGENSLGLSFESVIVEVTCHDDSAAATGISSWLIGVKLGAVAFADTTKTITLSPNMTFGSETHSYCLQSDDLASYFNSNFGAGSSQTCQIGIQFGGAATINHTARLIITYSYDWETSTSRTKTVRIPIESGTSYLSTTLTQIGTNQVPQLTGAGGFIKEASPTIKSLDFVVETIPGEPGTTDFQLALALDSESEVVDGLHESALNSNYFYRRVWNRNDLIASGTAATHQFKARSVGTTAFFKLRVILVVTYTFVESSTTSVTNHIAVPFQIKGLIPAIDHGYAYADVEVDIQENGTIAMLQSAVVLDWEERYGTTTASVRVGAQTARSYFVSTVPGGQLVSGVVHRIDSGGAQGSALTLARGKNTIRVFVGIAAGFDSLLWNVSGVLLLNYSSSKTGDTHVHANTIAKNVLGTQLNGAASVRYADVAALLPSDEPWHVKHAGLVAGVHSPNTTIVIAADIETDIGLANLWTDIVFSGGTCGFHRQWMPFEDLVGRYDGDADGFNLVLPHEARIGSTGDGTSNPCFFSLALWYTFNGITYTVSGTVSGYPLTAFGSGIDVEVFDATSHELVATGTTVTGGAYSITVYDNSRQVYVVARDGASGLRGRSANGTPGSGFNINIGKSDSTAPVHTVVSPTPGLTPGLVGGFPADYASAKDTPIVIDIDDTSPGTGFGVVWRELPSGGREIIWIADTFIAPYTSSSQSAPATGKKRLTIRYNGGWPADIGHYGIDIRSRAIDLAGNIGSLD